MNSRDLIIFCITAAAITAGTFQRRATALTGEAHLVRERRELRTLAKFSPGITVTNATTMEKELRRIEEANASLRRELTPRIAFESASATSVEPSTRTDAFFDIASGTEVLRRAATEAGVSVSADERFGFSAYRNEGPDTDVMRTVYRQRRTVTYLCERLFETRPMQFLSVQRERPVVLTQTKKTKSTAETPQQDFFELPPSLSLRALEHVNALAFRVSFVGHTAQLRSFFTALLKFELPIVIRLLEVEGAPVAETRAPAAPFPVVAPDPTGVVEQPVVAPPLLKFSVTVELFELPSPAARVAKAIPGSSD